MSIEAITTGLLSLSLLSLIQNLLEPDGGFRILQILDAEHNSTL